jgi:hypothetical protein
MNSYEFYYDLDEEILDILDSLGTGPWYEQSDDWD